MSHPITPAIKDKAFQYLLNTPLLFICERVFIARLCDMPLPKDMFQHMAHYPLTGTHFHVCLTFLQNVPQIRSRLPLCANISKEWNLIVIHWEELEAVMSKLYPKCYRPNVYPVEEMTLFQKRLDEVLLKPIKKEVLKGWMI